MEICKEGWTPSSWRRSSHSPEGAEAEGWDLEQLFEVWGLLEQELEYLLTGSLWEEALRMEPEAHTK